LFDREGKPKPAEPKEGEPTAGERPKASEPKEGKSKEGKSKLERTNQGGDGSQSAASSRGPRVRRSRHDQSGSVDGRGGVSGRVWTLGPDGKLRSVGLTLGLSDGSATEVLGGDLKEGQEVVVGFAGGSGGKRKSVSSPRLGS